MSFFFAPVQCNYQPTYLIVPFLPCYFQIQKQNDSHSNSSFASTEVKQQEMSSQCTQDKKIYCQLGKCHNFIDESYQDKVSGQLCQQTKKPSSPACGHQNDECSISSSIQLKEKMQNSNFENSDIKSSDKLVKTIKIKKNKQLNEEEYKPFEKKKKNQCNSKQNQNRNIIPNEVNQIFSYIQKSSKSNLVVSRILKKYQQPNEKYNVKRFYLYQSLLKERISNYINQGSLSLVTELYEPKCQVFPEQQQRYYNKVCRILILHFLQEDSIFNILTSRRMHKDKKRNHLQMRRVLKQKVVQIIKH